MRDKSLSQSVSTHVKDSTWTCIYNIIYGSTTQDIQQFIIKSVFKDIDRIVYFSVLYSVWDYIEPIALNRDK